MKREPPVMLHASLSEDTPPVVSVVLQIFATLLFIGMMVLVWF